MIKSMTGYAEVVYDSDQLLIKGTIRSYNSRHLDTVLYLPDNLKRFEDGVKAIVSSRISRGRVEIRLGLEEIKDASVCFTADHEKAKAYMAALQELRTTLGIKEHIGFKEILSLKNVIQTKEPELDPKTIQDSLNEALKEGLNDLEEMRIKEGQHLEDDLEKRFFYMEDMLDKIEKQAGDIPTLYKKRLEERIRALLADTPDILDPSRLAQETAILADKSDISEEIVRARSHIIQARQIVSSDAPSGRKLNFLVQEFNREYNTMGSKSGNVEISQMVVDLKSELEKIREQVQNIE